MVTIKTDMGIEEIERALKIHGRIEIGHRTLKEAQATEAKYKEAFDTDISECFGYHIVNIGPR